MSNNDSVIDDNWSFSIHIEWWEILLGIAALILLIYFLRKKRKRLKAKG